MSEATGNKVEWLLSMMNAEQKPEIVQAKFLESQRAKDQRVLSPQEQAIIHGSYVRLFGHDTQGKMLSYELQEKDEDAIVAINNALVLKGEQALDDEQLKEAARRGFQISEIEKGTTIPTLLRQGGYAFLVEVRDDEGNATPYGAQFGFPHMPRKYHNLALKSLPTISAFLKHEQDTFTIWRTSILRRIDTVREQFGRLQIPVSPVLEGEVLQNKGAGLATKLVDAQAALDLEKSLVQCNISELVRPGNIEDMVAQNERSFGSNLQVFNLTKFIRHHADKITTADGKPVLEVIWHILNNTPQKMIEILTSVQSPIVSKGWDIQKLRSVGHLLGDAIRDKRFRRLSITRR